MIFGPEEPSLSSRVANVLTTCSKSGSEECCAMSEGGEKTLLEMGTNFGLSTTLGVSEDEVFGNDMVWICIANVLGSKNGVFLATTNLTAFRLLSALAAFTEEDT